MKKRKSRKIKRKVRRKKYGTLWKLRHPVIHTQYGFTGKVHKWRKGLKGYLYLETIYPNGKSTIKKVKVTSDRVPFILG